jgi:hypothetical protein
LSYFEDELFGFVEELGRVGVWGHEKVEREEKKVFETACEVFKEWLDLEIEDSLGDLDFVSLKSPARLGADGLQWRHVNDFFNDLSDYSFERKSIMNQAFWRKTEKWVFEVKVTQKNSSRFRFKALSWEEVG